MIHTQVLASNGAHVDEGLLPLLEALWKLGMHTEFSCQNFGTRRRPWDSEMTYGYICFTKLEDGMKFITHSCHILDGYDIFALETNGARCFIDFPAHKLTALTDYWQRFASS